jgi:hypothetical protein
MPPISGQIGQEHARHAPLGSVGMEGKCIAIQTHWRGRQLVVRNHEEGQRCSGPVKGSGWGDSDHGLGRWVVGIVRVRRGN